MTKNTETLALYSYGIYHQIYFYIDNYSSNDNLYVGMILSDDDYPEPWGDLTVNLDVKCEPNCAYIDINNNPGILQWLYENNLGKLTGKSRTSGWCEYPEFEFNMEELNKYI